MDQAYDERLETATTDTKQRFTLKGFKRYAKVVSVYDGDTLDLIFYQRRNDKEPIRYKCRMSGYDAPELDEEPYGTRAKYYLAHLCMGETAVTVKDFNQMKPWSSGRTPLEDRLKNKKLVYAEFDREGKYGRPVVKLFQVDDKRQPSKVSINKMMQEFIGQQNPAI